MENISERKQLLLPIALFIFALLFAAPGASAYGITTPYFCGSYWSSVPCSNYGYGNWGYNYYPYNNYYQYPYYYNNYYQYTYPQPTCSISYSETTQYGYPYYGYNRPIVVSWYSNNATSAYIYPSVGSVSTYGSTSLYPSWGTTYTLTVYGPGGTNTCQTTYYGPTTYYGNYQENYYGSYYPPFYYNYSYPYNYQW